MNALVSTVIPTFDRRRDVVVAVQSALSQTHSPQEIIVVDDGSRDGTTQCLGELFGDSITILRTERLGVSGARNRGMAAAKGEFIALLDSDDDWAPEKLERQVAFLEAHPDYGMVLTDVVQMDSERREFDVLHRRKHIPEDGDVLRHVLRQPALAPSSALFRRRVLDEVGAFDTSLPTAEDIDFHLRVALSFKIGVVEGPLTRATRNHDGLSELARTYADYMFVVERFLEDHRDAIPARDRRAALRVAALRNMRGMLGTGLVGEAVKLGAGFAVKARTPADVAALAAVSPRVLWMAARKAARRLDRRNPIAFVPPA